MLGGWAENGEADTFSTLALLWPADRQADCAAEGGFGYVWLCFGSEPRPKDSADCRPYILTRPVPYEDSGKGGRRRKEAAVFSGR